MYDTYSNSSSHALPSCAAATETEAFSPSASAADGTTSLAQRSSDKSSTIFSNSAEIQKINDKNSKKKQKKNTTHHYQPLRKLSSPP